MLRQSMAMLLAFLLSVSLNGERAEAADIYSYTPFLYKIPEGSVGVFRNGGQFYDDFYPAGVYMLWPYDEGFTISTLPEKVKITEVPCMTVDGIEITLPAVTVRYQVHKEAVVELIKNYDIDFVKQIIEKPIMKGIADLCLTMTAEAVYLERFSLIKPFMTAYLAREQRDRVSGVSVCGLEIDRPRVPDEIIQNFVGRYLSPKRGDHPYEIFYTLEAEKEARERRCRFDQQRCVSEEELRGGGGLDLVAPAEPAAVPIPGEAPPQSTLHADHGITPEEKLPEQGSEPFFDNEPSYPDREKSNLYPQMQQAKALWKNNNGRLYLGWQ